MENDLKKFLRRVILIEVTLVLLIMAMLLYLTFFAPPKDTIHFYGVIGVIVLLFMILATGVLQQQWIRRYLRASIREIEKSKEKNEDMTREVIGNITHDLKTPLTAIRGYAQGILDGVASSSDRLNKYATTIRNKAEDMAGLVDDLSFFSQIYQQNNQYNLQYVNASDYLSRCISETSLDMEMKKISLMYQFDADKKTIVKIDSEKMKRVITNIVGNSAKYIRTDMGMVYVHIEEDEKNLIVHISDNGEGIAEDDLKKIFERFYRTDRSRNSSTGGSGIGLAIAKKITEDLGGEIWAKSKSGVGTTISFSLPKVLDEIVEIC